MGKEAGARPWRSLSARLSKPGLLSLKQKEALELFKQGCDTIKAEIQEDYPCGKEKEKLRSKLFLYSPHLLSQRSLGPPSYCSGPGVRG